MDGGRTGPAGVGLGPVLVTRPEPEASAWVEVLRSQGFAARAWPLIEIGEPQAPELRQALDRWRRDWVDCDALMFVSSSAVQRFMASSDLARPAADAPVRFWAPGPGTARVLAHALQTLGLPADRIDSPLPDAAQFDSEHLWPVVRAQAAPGRRVLVVRGRTVGQPEAAEGGLAGHGRDWLMARCREAGAQVDLVVAYERRPAVFDVAALRQLAGMNAPGSVWLLSASESVAALPGPSAGVDWSAACAVVTHPRIAEAAQALGFGRVVQTRPALPEVLRVLESLGSP
ncbi:MAG: uroporphyrinogen-III synthase [Comamonadaceae bacterium]|nr:uroporphyrinogen-III synthase [Comamonadaceae bacterium]